MLRAAKYRLRFNRKRLTRRSTPDRNQQFTNINRLKASFAQRGQPVISVDAKKRELVGLFKNQGREWRKAPIDVDMYDFPGDADGVAIPYGIYDVTRGDGVRRRRNLSQYARFRRQCDPPMVATRRSPHVLRRARVAHPCRLRQLERRDRACLEGRPATDREQDRAAHQGGALPDWRFQVESC
jgi:hypothetical protein